eukprot:TRINITY_DN7999_c0_g1_i2.p2 TRINITY_DN7999_c0_g1~~TRINITY_DN7999_c0_g1_i2.p2  ORF type:complete len:192 (-),score=34.61 TRINITY_DN7999_c0_g1_i2:747-1292(-)
MGEQDVKQTCLKIGLLGDDNVGKTSLMNTYYYGNFDEEHPTTLSISYREKIIKRTEEKEEVVVTMWDVGGMNDCMRMIPLVTEEAHALLFLFDLNRKLSLLSIKDWYKQARVHNRSAIPFLVGTKFDLFVEEEPSRRFETIALAKKFAKAMKAPLVFISSRASINLQSLFKSKFPLLTLSG